MQVSPWMLQLENLELSWWAGRPEDSGISLQVVQELGPQLPLFGVCMGHQCIGQIYGGVVVRSPTGIMHGKTSLVYHTGEGVLQVWQPCMASLQC